MHRLPTLTRSLRLSRLYLPRCRTTLPSSTARWNSTIPSRQTPHTPVEDIILNHIKLTGPISFATYMQLCLSHPDHGYYMNPANKVFGAGGDFITSPEISQVFGELIALWLLQEYMRTAKGAPLRIVELGPGKGTLLGDVLRVILKFAPQKSLNVHLVETSLALRDIQKGHLTSQNHSNVHLHWHNSISEIPPSSSEYTMLVAHEFFDALPVHILQKKKETEQWHEVLIASKDDKVRAPEGDEVAQEVPSPVSEESPSTLRRVLASKPSSVGAVLGLSSARFGEMPEESFLEVSPTAFRIARKVGELLTRGQPEDENASLGGCGLIIDYGGARAYSDSLRAFKNHEIVDIFHEPGKFTPLGPTSQGSFLAKMGLGVRLRTLLQAAATEERQQAIHSAAMRLIDPKGMGGQYQVLGITGERSKDPNAPPLEIWPFIQEEK
ncbi:hypothetical protein D9613_007842 [Agrocybe pediades]|uniref:Protein arginine methyltransferase NDUFAF7 n=1 Tax=Agrocybe pediades TaxID=84607 RepID=A0A8H4QN03_9AGAR|nr:hypothetical protein D9613_007842 [Agrocybe pediades]